MPGIELLAKDRGMRFNDTKELASATGVTDAVIAISSSELTYYKVVDKIWIACDDVPTKLDFAVDIVDMINGAYELYALDDAGVLGPTDPRLVLDWLDPNPPTNTIIGVIVPNLLVLEPAGDSISIDGVNATAGDNYTGTSSIALKFSVIGRKIEEDLWDIPLL